MEIQPHNGRHPAQEQPSALDRLLSDYIPDEGLRRDLSRQIHRRLLCVMPALEEPEAEWDYSDYELGLIDGSNSARDIARFGIDQFCGVKDLEGREDFKDRIVYRKE